MSNSHKDQDDWGDDSAALFRDARRAHDPTLAERASFDRVLTRIQAGSTAQPSAATRAGLASRAATAAKFSLVVLGVAAAYVAFDSAGRDSSIPPQTTESATLPTPAPRSESVDLQPASTKPSSTTREARREDESPSRNAPRRSRVSTGRQRGVVSKNEDAIVAAPTAAIAQDQSPSALHNERMQAEASQQLSAASDVTATPKPARRDGSREPSLQQAVGPAEATPRATHPAASVAELTRVEPTVQQAVVVAPAEPTSSATPAPSVSELTLLKRMQAALRAADFTTALALCAEHERRWLHGTFELEREGVHAIASCSLSTDDALPRAKRFLASHPHASLAMRVRSACRKQLNQGR